MGFGIKTKLRQLWRLPGEYFLGTITHVATADPVVALTFDDGPNPEFTPALLDVLARHGAKATFFVVGEQAQKHPDLIRRLSENGHAIGNHSWDHPSFPDLSSAERRRQIRACEKALGEHSSRLFRPPYGRQNLAGRLDAWLSGLPVVTWNVPSAWDWLPKEPEWMVGEIRKRLQPGSIILLHDSLHDRSPSDAGYDRRPTIAAVDLLLTELAAQYVFITIPELLRRGKVIKRNWYQDKPE
ncbi:polysaccharide deacetylase family protein [Methyloterricola oryzae]|uniref:polysaccharide deacetylase family protein n=1 Tax=Methyloterricola oryzae TaxID=1495050 RepID=UPI0006999606|nr:polysaccharide deacetylase family protein [Methyloterricola oryzae]